MRISRNSHTMISRVAALLLLIITTALAVRDWAQVALTAPGFQFDTPLVHFTNENWQTPQTVVAVAASRAITGQASLQIGTTVNAPCLPVHKCPFQYYVNHNTAASQACTINGDPHFQTFSGAVYWYQGAGGLNYLQSNFLQVQAYQYPCSAGSAVAYVGSVTIRYGDSIFVVNGMDNDNNSKNTGGATLTTLGSNGAL
ncbi:hypothetical protein BC830DRAFT_1217846 [Chytriomyces sp. MP71]|nr:hypothetical protein BC830DRAFT_1217846 [Chytriomyces sp. MP71]